MSTMPAARHLVRWNPWTPSRNRTGALQQRVELGVSSRQTPLTSLRQCLRIAVTLDHEAKVLEHRPVAEAFRIVNPNPQVVIEDVTVRNFTLTNRRTGGPAREERVPDGTGLSSGTAGRRMPETRTMTTSESSVERGSGKVVAHRLTCTVRANWKAVVDNFLECYHCPACG